jgi:hypothetical protein
VVFDAVRPAYLWNTNPMIPIDKVSRLSKTFNIQFDEGEFDLHCPLCGGWLHAFHLRDDKEAESVDCLDCKVEVNISADLQKRILSLEINDGKGWEFEDGGDGSKSGSKRI